MRSDRERLQDIFEAIERIEKYAQKGRGTFEKDELIQTWIVYHLQVIGEASRKLSDAFKDSYSDIPWAQIIAMRNIVVHEYFFLDQEEVWTTIERDIPQLKHKIKAILSKLK